MYKIPDYIRLISSPPFTFLVGKEHTKLTIQSGLAKHVSRPLDDLMNNGRTRESKHRIAVLEEEEVEVFTAFTQYAYSGNYTVPVQRTELPPVEPPSAFPASGPGPAVPTSHGRNRSVSFLPPPAPTPPPFEQLDSTPSHPAGPPAPAEGEQWENPFAQPIEQQNTASTQENTPAEDSKQEEVAQDEQQAEGGDPMASPQSKKSKKDKKKKRKNTVSAATVAFDENLTPPTTPPLDVRDVREERNTQGERFDMQPSAGYDPDCAVESDPGDDGGDGGDGDWWDQPIAAQNETQGDYEERLANARRIQQQQQSQHPQPHTSPMIDTSFGSHRMAPAPSKKGVKSFDEFTALSYFHQRSGDEFGVTTPAPSLVGHSFIVPYILFHAKVYVFAMRFLIPGLAQLCLQKLHASLVIYPLTPPIEDDGDNDRQYPNPDIELIKFNAHARMFLDTFQYSYERTTRYEPESQTSATLLRECELRKLVSQYASCKMRELAAYTPAPIPVPSSPSHGPGSGANFITAPGGGLRELMDKVPELASDLVFLMM